MTLADLDLAQRLAAVPGIWRAGMADALGRRVLARDQAEMLYLLDEFEELAYTAGPIPCPEWVDA